MAEISHISAMAILKIANMGHPVLRERAAEVENPQDPAISTLVQDMIETLEDAGGIGLAAPQVHTALRVVIFYIPEHRAEGDPEADPNAEDAPQPLTVMINPIIEPLGEEKSLDWEACLSVPDLMGAVPRYNRIRYRWTDPSGEQKMRTASGFHARAVQHECDHLDGILYPMRMTDLSLLMFSEEARRFPVSLDAQAEAAE